MKIVEEYPVKVFSKQYNDKTYYKIGLSKKDGKGGYINGYMDAYFQKNTYVDSNKKIYIKDAWLDFYIKDNITHPYIFINDFDYLDDVIKEQTSGKVYTKDIELTDDDMPF